MTKTSRYLMMYCVINIVLNGWGKTVRSQPYTKNDWHLPC